MKTKKYHDKTIRRQNAPIFLLLAVFLVFFFGCKQKTAETSTTISESKYTAIDARGVTVQLEQPAQRVVVLFESLVDGVFMLGAQDRLMGVPSQVYLTPDSYEFFSTLSPDFAAKKIATPTFNGRTVNMESLMALQPDLVITFLQDLQMIEQMEELGIEVFAALGSNVETTLREFEGMGALLGKEERAKMITDYLRGEIETMNDLIPEKKKTAYYVWSRGRVLSTSGKGTVLDSAIRLAGLENACPLEMESPNIGVELLYQWNPDLMILWNTPVSDVYALKELEKLPAVANKQVFEMRPIFLFDPHTVKLVLFSKQVKQWAYPDLYPKEIFEREMEEAKKLIYDL